MFEAQAQNNRQKYRLVISFVSICCGTNREAHDKLDAFISRYEKKKKKKLTMEKLRWGKEGEFDYCFQLKELSKSEREKFIAEIKTLLKGEELIEIKENTTSYGR